MIDPDDLMQRLDALAEDQFRNEPESLDKYRRVLRIKFLESLAEHPERLATTTGATDGQLCRMLETNIAKIPALPPAAKAEPPQPAPPTIEMPRPELAPANDSPEWLFRHSEPQESQPAAAEGDVLELDKIEVASPYYKPSFPADAQPEPELDLPPPPAVKPPDPENPTIIFCPHCKELNPFNNAKCDNCGTPLHEPYTFRPPEVIVDKGSGKNTDYESKALVAFFLSFLTCCCGPFSIYVFILSINELKNATETQNIILAWLAMILSGINLILFIIGMVLRFGFGWDPLAGFKM